MKIKSQLPQFIGEKSIISVITRHNIEIYLAGNGLIDKMEDINLPKAKYSDREGFFLKAGRGAEYRSGSVYENNKNNAIIEMAKKFLEKLKIWNKQLNPDSFFLFLPKEIKNKVLDKLPGGIKKKIKSVQTGNFKDAHPFLILEKIKKRPKKISPEELPREAKKLITRKKTLKEVDVKIKGRP